MTTVIDKVMERVRCNLCMSNSIKLLYDYKRYKIVKCRKCGLVYLNPRPSSQELAKLYDKDYFAGNSINRSITRQELIDKLKSPRIVEGMLQVKKVNQKGKLLDIGCGLGFFLKCAEKEGYECFGLEISEYSSDYARKKLGLNVKTGTLESVEYGKEEFDVITLWHSLEHHPNPKYSLEKIHYMLKKNGFLFIELPNFNCLASKWRRKRWEGLRIPTHFYHFTAKTIGKLLWKAGFEVVKVNYYPLGIISRILKSVKGRNNFFKLKEVLGMVFPGWNMMIIAKKCIKNEAEEVS